MIQQDQVLSKKHLTIFSMAEATVCVLVSAMLIVSYGYMMLPISVGVAFLLLADILVYYNIKKTSFSISCKIVYSCFKMLLVGWLGQFMWSSQNTMFVLVFVLIPMIAFDLIAFLSTQHKLSRSKYKWFYYVYVGVVALTMAFLPYNLSSAIVALTLMSSNFVIIYFVDRGYTSKKSQIVCIVLT